MELNDFEKIAKKKLASREINASEGSWEKLDAKLKGEKGKRNFTKYWFAIAAIAVVAFLVANPFFENFQSPPAIVEEPKENFKEKTGETEDFTVPVQMASKENRPENEAEKSPSVLIPKPQNQNFERKQITAVTEIDVSSREVMSKLKIEQPEEQIKTNNNEMQNLIAGVIAEQLENDLSEQEVDKLLLEAANRIAAKKNYNTDISISASSLLAEVNSEIDQSFRRKVFELLKEGFQEASYALSNR
ncbi:hypothetical protein ACW6QP_12545 [Salegentibacter sp. HM20]